MWFLWLYPPFFISKIVLQTKDQFIEPASSGRSPSPATSQAATARRVNVRVAVSRRKSLIATSRQYVTRDRCDVVKSCCRNGLCELYAGFPQTERGWARHALRRDRGGTSTHSSINIISNEPTSPSGFTTALQILKKAFSLALRVSLPPFCADLYGTCLLMYLDRYDLVNCIVRDCWSAIREWHRRFHPRRCSSPFTLGWCSEL